MSLKAYQHQLGPEESKIMTNYQLSRGSDSPVECNSHSFPFSAREKGILEFTLLQLDCSSEKDV